MKRVILLAPYFPPRRRVGSYRTFKFAIHLKKFGWEPLVIHLKVNNGSLSPWEQILLKDIRCYEITLPFDRSMVSSGSYLPVGDNKVKKVPEPSYLSELFDRSFPIDTWWPLLRYHQRNLQKILHDFRPDIMWSTADPWSSHVLAMNLVNKFSVPWVADFRDPWTLCPIRSAPRMPWARAIDRKTEKKILSRANHVIFTAENTTRLYRAHYPEMKDSMSTIYNSFDNKYFLPVKNQNSSNKEESKFTILFYGRFRPLSSAALVIRLLKRVKEIDNNVFDSIIVQSCGVLSEADSLAANSVGVLSAFQTTPPEPYENTLRKLDQADLLLLSTEPERSEIIPAKFWDYLIAKKTILSLSQNPEISRILLETKTGKQFSLSELNEAAEFLITCYKAKEAGADIPYSKSDKEAEIQAYSSLKTTAQLARIFNQLSNG